ncbi:MAG: mycofactocin system FadH/OYE family oxidoreductase 2, partial [Gammaproteobacteria bacterium]|nr:mycofactocin system FadH/OYE family oxidoreductase 2 [Gammaproteobacteria bacterium]
MSTESATHPRFPHLLSPIQIGPRRLRCRVLVTAHEIRLGDGRIPGPRYAAYHRARARGGAGLQITGCTAVHRTGGLGSGGALANVDDSIIDGYRTLSGAVHEEGGVILAQLGHSAATTHATEPGAPVWAPSAVAGELMRHGQRAHAMSVDEIAEIVAAFGAAAERCRKGGMDGVEILAAFGFLVAAFLSPLANRRTDHYGGSLDNRMRFCREVVCAVRDAVGPDGVVGLRIPGDELIEDGLELDEMKAVARAVESDGKVDYLNVIAGTNMDRLLRAEHWPPTPAQHGLFVHLAAGIRSAVELPVFTVGRITDPVQAEQILADGEADMVGMTRAHVADPDLIAKLREGRVDDIRPCVGANVCIRNGLEGRSIGCIHNPQAGRELT